MLKPKALDSSDVWIPPLENGDQLSRDEFERRYEVMPHVRKAELIEGIVYMPSPARLQLHATPHSHLAAWLATYEAHTPGVRSGAGPTVRLDEINEPQPDAVLVIDPECGGQASISEDDYLEGAPELAAEVSASTVSIDLNKKLEVYRRNGVREYIVWRVLDEELDWFVLRGTDYERLDADADGILRSPTFPGLWLDAPALIRLDLVVALHALQSGLQTTEHAEFVARLQSQRA